MRKGTAPFIRSECGMQRRRAVKYDLHPALLYVLLGYSSCRQTRLSRAHLGQMAMNTVYPSAIV